MRSRVRSDESRSQGGLAVTRLLGVDPASLSRHEDGSRQRPCSRGSRTKSVSAAGGAAPTSTPLSGRPSGSDHFERSSLDFDPAELYLFEDNTSTITLLATGASRQLAHLTSMRFWNRRAGRRYFYEGLRKFHQAGQTLSVCGCVLTTLSVAIVAQAFAPQHLPCAALQALSLLQTCQRVRVSTSTTACG